MHRFIAVSAALLLTACGQEQAPADATDAASDLASTPEFQVHVDRFADVEVLRYEVPGFDELSLQEKKLAYYLSQAALSGRGSIFDQH